MLGLIYSFGLANLHTELLELLPKSVNIFDEPGLCSLIVSNTCPFIIAQSAAYNNML